MFGTIGFPWDQNDFRLPAMLRVSFRGLKNLMLEHIVQESLSVYEVMSSRVLLFGVCSVPQL